MDFISIKEKKTDVDKKPFGNPKNLRKGKKRFKLKGGVIYIGHIPHGFYEDQMREYFGQFGEVLDTIVARSKKTGRSKGYGFVHFKNEDVAKIAAESMNNYLMYSRIIKCRYIPPKERVGNMFANRITPHDYPRKINRKIEMQNKLKALSNLNQKIYMKKVRDKIHHFKKFFEKNGIEFTFKLSDKSSQDNERSEAKNSSNDDVESKSEKETEDFNGVLEIDESEDEISFKTPPQVKKVIKKSNNSLIEAVKKNKSNSKKIIKVDKSKAKTALKNQTLKKKNNEKIVENKKKNEKIVEDKEKNEKIVENKKKNEKILENKKKNKESLKKLSTTKEVKKRLQKKSTESDVSEAKKVKVGKHTPAKSKIVKKERYFSAKKCKEEN